MPSARSSAIASCALGRMRSATATMPASRPSTATAIAVLPCACSARMRARQALVCEGNAAIREQPRDADQHGLSLDDQTRGAIEKARAYFGEGVALAATLRIPVDNNRRA